MLDALIVTPGSAADLERRDPRDTLGLPGKGEAATQLDGLLEEFSSLQERLWILLSSGSRPTSVSVTDIPGIVIRQQGERKPGDVIPG